MTILVEVVYTEEAQKEYGLEDKNIQFNSMEAYEYFCKNIDMKNVLYMMVEPI